MLELKIFFPTFRTNKHCVMENRNTGSMILLGAGIILIIFGIYSMNVDDSLLSNVFEKEDAGMYILSIGAVVSIFATGSMVGKKS